MCQNSIDRGSSSVRNVFHYFLENFDQATIDQVREIESEVRPLKCGNSIY